jgi:rhamnosyltransferase
MTSAITAEPRRVSVVIPTLNGGPRFGALLDALAGQDLEDGLQLVVVDSQSDDDTADRARAMGARVETIERRHFNHGRTRNHGISLSSGEVVLLLTQDAVPMDAGYARALSSAYDDPVVDAAYARQFPQPDCDPILAERLRRWSASRSEPVLQSLAPGDPDAARARWDELSPMERYLACAFDNVASSVRRSSWERRPFPERSFGEDVAFGRELLLGGGTIRFTPDARVEHSHRIEMKREFKRLYCDHRNLSEMFGLRNVPSWRAVLDGWKHQRGVYRELLTGQDLGAAERLWWRAYAIPYALAETTAQFLGARSPWKTGESRFWDWADRKLRAGI